MLNQLAFIRHIVRLAVLVHHVVLTMAGQMLFCLIGDSNVKRNMNPTNCNDRPQMMSAQVLVCNRFEVFGTALRSVKEDVDVCVLSCLSNFLTSTEETSTTVSHRVSPILTEFLALVVSACEEHPDRKYLICPPMYRLTPLWYRDGLSQILTSLSALYQRNRQANLGLLPSFSGPVLDSDGIHLTPYSGLEFVLHLFNSSKTLLKTHMSSTEEKQSSTSEAARLLEDRVVALEQDHRRLSSEVDLRTAIKAEFDDFTANERSEDSFIISGLPRISGRLTGLEWQERAKADVGKIISTMMGSSLLIQVVHNSTGPSPSAEVTYSVQMSRLEDAKAVKSKFGSYFRGGRDGRPQELSRISIQNLVTRETRVRISIMKLLAKRYVAANPEGKAHVIGYLPRPLLKIIPPPTAKNKRIMSYNFIEAVQKLPVNFTREEIGDITNRAGQRFPGKLRSLFIVLSDDHVEPKTVRSKRRLPADDQGEPSERRARFSEATEVADADVDDVR